MFLSVSKNKTVRAGDIIGIFDADTATVSAVTKAYLNQAEQSGRVTGDGSLPNSFVIIRDNSVILSGWKTQNIVKSWLRWRIENRIIE